MAADVRAGPIRLGPSDEVGHMTGRSSSSRSVFQAG